MTRFSVRVLTIFALLGLQTPWSAVSAQETAAPASQVESRVSVPQLLKNLEADAIKVSSSAARSLGVIFAAGTTPRPEAEQVTKQLILCLGSPQGAALRREAAVALGRMRKVEALEPLTQAMADEDVTVAVAAGEAVGQTLPVDDARKLLLAKGAEESESLQAAAYAGLAPIAKAEDKEFLVRGLGLSNWRTRQAAVTGLERAALAGAKLDPADYRAAAGVLGSETLNASEAAMHFFLAVRNDAAQAAVFEAAETKGDGAEDDASWRLRAQALRTIRHLGWSAIEPGLPVVVRQLGDRTANVVNEAKRIINQSKKDNLLTQEELFPILLAELEKAEDLRLCGGLMAEMGRHVDRQFASRVAQAADRTLKASLEPEAAAEWVARTNALYLLGASGYTGVMEPVAQCVQDNVANVRQAAGEALAALHEVCPDEEKTKVAPLLLPLLTSPVDWRKTAVAAGAVGYYADESCVAPLTQLLSHSVLNVREAASQSLVWMVEHAPATQREAVAAAVTGEADKNEKAWEFAAPVLGALEDAENVARLTRMLEQGDWRAKAAAATAANRIATVHPLQDKPLSDALIAAAQSEVVQLQEAANQALRTLNK